MRVLIGLTDVAAYGGRLRRGFDELGIHATFVNLHDHPAFRFGGGSEAPPVLLAQRVMGRRLAATSLLSRLWWTLLEGPARILLLLWAVLRFDAFIFLIGNSFLYGYDLPLLRLLGKKVALVYLGSDERPVYLNGASLRGKAEIPLPERVRQVEARRAKLARVAKHADVVVSHLMSSQLQPAPIVPFLWVGYPSVDVSAGQAPAVLPESSTTRVLHAPSHPEVKGTALVRECIERLRSRGHDIELIELTGRPHAEVLDELRRCDFVVDEVWSDTPLGGIATEAASFGKPAVVGGYGWELLRSAMPAERVPPSATCEPEALEATIEWLIRNPAEARSLGERARAFLEQQWRPAHVAGRYLALFRGERPDAGWITDPGVLPYVHGYGMPAAMVRRIIREQIEAGGAGALGLSERPALERALVEFAAERDAPDAEAAA